MTEIRTLEDICTQIVDCEHKTAPIDPNGEYFAVGTPAMRGNAINYSESRRISKETFISWTRRMVPVPGDLLFAREAPVGPVVRIPDAGNVAPGQRTMLLRPDPEQIDSRFLFYLLASPRQQELLLSMAAGSTVAHLNVADVRAFKLPPLPDLPQQKAIASILGALDNKIAANTKVAAGATQLALTLASVPKPSVPLGNVVVHKRKSISPRDLEVSRVAHYSLPAYDDVELPHTSAPTEIKSSKFLIERPCVLISKLNPRFPRVWNITDVPAIPALASTEFLVLESPYTTTTVLWALLRQETFGFKLESKVAGTSGSHQRVKPTDLLATLVADPRLIGPELTQKITTLGECILNARLENAALADIRNALLPHLMSGKLRLKDAEKVMEDAGV